MFYLKQPLDQFVILGRLINRNYISFWCGPTKSLQMAVNRCQIIDRYTKKLETAKSTKHGFQNLQRLARLCLLRISVVEANHWRAVAVGEATYWSAVLILLTK